MLGSAAESKLATIQYHMDRSLEEGVDFSRRSWQTRNVSTIDIGQSPFNAKLSKIVIYPLDSDKKVFYNLHESVLFKRFVYIYIYTTN